MRLEQGQVWKQGDEYFRIIEWARLSIQYKLFTDPLTREGTVHEVTKKEFCRLIKGAELVKLEKPVAEAPGELEGFDDQPLPGEPLLDVVP